MLTSIPFPYEQTHFLAWLGAYQTAERDGLDRARAIVDEDDNAIGLVKCQLRDGRFEFGYWVAESYWGRGIASAALGRFLKWYFAETRLPELAAAYMPENKHSEAILLRAGCVATGERITRHSKGRQGQAVEVIVVGLTEAHFLASALARTTPMLESANYWAIPSRE